MFNSQKDVSKWVWSLLLSYLFRVSSIGQWDCSSSTIKHGCFNIIEEWLWTGNIFLQLLGTTIFWLQLAHLVYLNVYLSQIIWYGFAVCHHPQPKWNIVFQYRVMCPKVCGKGLAALGLYFLNVLFHLYLYCNTSFCLCALFNEGTGLEMKIHLLDCCIETFYSSISCFILDYLYKKVFRHKISVFHCLFLCIL